MLQFAVSVRTQNTLSFLRRPVHFYRIGMTLYAGTVQQLNAVGYRWKYCAQAVLDGAWTAGKIHDERFSAKSGGLT